MSVGTQAFYILFAENVLSPQWPQKLCQNNGRGAQGTECVDARKYQNGVFIASPQNFTTDLIAKVKKDVPGSSVVAYWDFGDIPLACVSWSRSFHLWVVPSLLPTLPAHPGSLDRDRAPQALYRMSLLFWSYHG